MRIAHKLKLNSLVVLTLITLNIIVTIFLVNRMMKDTRQLTEVEEPLEEAVLEMEINAGETARAVFDYIWDHEDRDLERMKDSDSNFERYAKVFDRLAETEEEKSLGQEVSRLYRDFKRLADEITNLKDRQFVNFQAFTAYTEKTNELIDDSLRESIDLSAPDAIEKILAISLMDEVLDEFVGQILAYIYASDPVLQQEMMKVDALFTSYRVRYLDTSHTADNEKLLEVIDMNFANAVRLGKEIVTITDQMHEKMEKFEDDLYEIDRILDDEIQILIHEQTTRAKDDALRSGEIAIVFLIIAGLLIFVIVFVIGRLVSKGIINATNRLTEGAEQFSKGNLDHRIKALSKDELGTLTNAFNDMAETLQNTTISRDELVKEVQSRKQTEYKLRQSEENLHITLESIGEGVIATDNHGNITRMNPVAELLTGWKLEETKNKPLADVFNIVNARTKEPVSDPVKRVLEGGEATGLENDTSLIAKDGAEHQIAKSASPIKDVDGEIKGVVLVFRDVTKEYEKQAQTRQQQKMEAIGTLAGGIAHDFNNVLSVIACYSEMGERSLPEDDEYREYFQEINAASNRAVDLVNQILIFTRQSDVKLEALIVGPLIEEAIKFLRATLPTTIEIYQNIQPDCGKIMAYPTQIHQIVMNLCTNAGYAMQENGGVLTIRLSDFEINKTNLPKPNMNIGNYVQLTVEDTGVGIPNETLEHIFDPFFTTKPVGEGTGMGLSVIHGIVEDYGGTITVESKIGKGTKFEIYFPVVKKDIKSPESETAVIHKGNERILFVDDEEILVKLEKKMAESFGYEVTIANSSWKALEIFESNKDKFDLIITDQTMPGMTGIELAKKIWEIHPDIPIILTTGFSHTIDEEKTRDLGFIGFLKKPINREVFLSTIRKALNRNN